MSSEKKGHHPLDSTCNYGFDGENSKIYDVNDEAGESILNYKIKKIICQIKSNEGIYGIQFIYRNINDGKEKTLINVKQKGLDLIEQEMTFGVEEIVDLRTWVSKDSKLIGFEITTNKGRSQKFGYGKDEDLRKIPEFENNENNIVGFCVSADDKNGVTSLFAYYLNKRTYDFHIYSGIFSLRIKIRDEKFKKIIENKLPTMNEKNKILYKICCLPDNQFFHVIKYALS